MSGIDGFRGQARAEAERKLAAERDNDRQLRAAAASFASRVEKSLMQSSIGRAYEVKWERKVAFSSDPEWDAFVRVRRKGSDKYSFVTGAGFSIAKIEGSILKINSEPWSKQREAEVLERIERKLAEDAETRAVRSGSGCAVLVCAGTALLTIVSRLA